MPPRFAEKYISARGIRTRYLELGSGEPLVFIHGGQYGTYDNAYAWSLNVPEIARHFRAIAFDKLGMGFTDAPSSPDKYTMRATVDHAIDFLEELGIERANLVGHSRGALVAARIAIERPASVKTLTVIDSNTLAPTETTAVPGDFYLKLEAQTRDPETIQSVQAEPIANSFSTEHITADMVEQWYRVAQLPSIRRMKQEIREMGGMRNLMPDLKKLKEQTLEGMAEGKLKAPTLIVWGYNDPSAPVPLSFKLFEIVARGTAASQLHIFNRAGHYCFREHANDFNSVAINFIRQS